MSAAEGFGLPNWFLTPKSLSNRWNSCFHARFQDKLFVLQIHFIHGFLGLHALVLFERGHFVHFALQEILPEFGFVHVSRQLAVGDVIGAFGRIFGFLEKIFVLLFITVLGRGEVFTPFQVDYTLGCLVQLNFLSSNKFLIIFVENLTFFEK